MTDNIVDFTDNLRVPRIDPTSNGYPVACEKVVIGGVTYYRQQTGVCGQNSLSGASEEIWKDAYTGSIVQIEIPHAAIHLGRYFSYSGVVTVANNASYDHLIRTPAPGGKAIHLRLFLFNADNAPISHTLYEEPTITDAGTLQIGRNFNRNYANATVEMRTAPTVTTPGAMLHTIRVVGSKQAGGAGHTSGTEWVLKPGTDYLSRVTNLSGVSTDIDYIAEWYEL